MLLVNVWSVIKFYRRAIITLWNLINITILAIIFNSIYIYIWLNLSLLLLLIYYYLLLIKFGPYRDILYHPCKRIITYVKF